MKKIVILMALIAVPTMGIAQEQEAEEVTPQDVYDSFVGCAAYHLARTKLEDMSDEAAAPDMAATETFLTAAFLTDEEKPKDDALAELTKSARAMIDETANGDAEAKKDFAELGEVCDDLKEVAQAVIEEVEAEALTNAT